MQPMCGRTFQVDLTLAAGRTGRAECVLPMAAFYQVGRSKVAFRSKEDPTESADSVEADTVENTGTGTVVRRQPTESELYEVQTMADAMRLLDEHGVSIGFGDELGDGFNAYPYKFDKLVGVPIFILSVRRGYSDTYVDNDGQPLPFSVIRFLLPGKDAREIAPKYFLTYGDTGSGMHTQISDYIHRKFGNDTGSGMVGLMVHNGLSRSDYKTKDKNGDEIAGTSWYLSTQGPGEG